MLDTTMLTGLVALVALVALPTSRLSETDFRAPMLLGGGTLAVIAVLLTGIEHLTF